MGRYMRKAKTTSDVAVMDSLTYGGVRTRAKTLALKKQAAINLRAAGAVPPPSSSPSSGGYLQLRSRRLEKKPPPKPPLHDSRRQQRSNSGQNNSQSGVQDRPTPNLEVGGTRVSRVGNDLQSESGEGKEGEEADRRTEVNEIQECDNNENNKDLSFIEASFGENILDIEGRDRSTRESTPCNLVRDTEDTRTPGSTTKAASPTETSRRLQNSMQRHIPTSREMDEFFGQAEEEQLRQFTEKYNFDPVNDKPLPGRYEWEKLDV